MREPLRDDLDNMEGVVHERDLLRVSQKGERMETFKSLIKPVHFVPETKPVDDLLQEMKEKGDQMVLVVDEYGGVSGLITMEDLIEEIVGEIHDESEAAGEKVIEESQGVYLVPGSLELHVKVKKHWRDDEGTLWTLGLGELESTTGCKACLRSRACSSHCAHPRCRSPFDQARRRRRR